MTTQRLALHRSSYSSSLVVVFTGKQQIRPSRKRLIDAVGSDPIGEGSFEAGGIIFQWPTGATYISRAQANDRQRLETRIEGPVWSGYEIPQDLMVKVLKFAAKRTPVSLGINATMSVMGETDAIRSVLAQYVDSTRVSRLTGRRNIKYGQVVFATEVYGTTFNLKLTPGKLAGSGGLRALIVDLNFSSPVTTARDILHRISLENLARFDRYSMRLFNRIK